MIGHEVVSCNECIRRNIFVFFVVVCFYFEYEKESTKIPTKIIGGVVGGAALLLVLLAALLLFKRKQKMPLSRNGFERAMTDFPSSHSPNTVAHGECVVR